MIDTCMRKGKLLNSLLFYFILAFVASCSEEHDALAPWDLDFEYSAYVAGAVRNDLSLDKVDFISTIDGIQIYRVPDSRSDVLSLKELKKYDLIYEATEKDIIRNFMKTLKYTGEKAIPDCHKAISKNTLHVVVYDRDFMRLGYLFIHSCEVNEGKSTQIIYIRTNGESGGYYSKETGDFLKSIDVNLE